MKKYRENIEIIYLTNDYFRQILIQIQSIDSLIYPKHQNKQHLKYKLRCANVIDNVIH